ncbi:GTP cyclohydrolase FolE2 [Sorangium sp. So ce1182]|uniref:GTP cyclohydrolase FolE2 n=1 Tax=Sorangium sp. So ce1182 TaxID=3133334 RepID=UPI003F63BFE2
MEDVQGRPDTRGVDIDEAGIHELSYPISFVHPVRGPIPTIGRFSMSVSVPSQVKGTHMSRFVELLHREGREISPALLPEFADKVRQRLHAKTARVEVKFTYFVDRPAPVTQRSALMDYQCTITSESSGAGAHRTTLAVEVPITTLCPCSKSISDYGAHNQRSYVTLRLRPVVQDRMLTVDELIELVERSSSAPCYPLLKRPDERHVTMQAYENPMFAEDVVRAAAVQLREDGRVAWFHVHVTNLESIHNHSAFAQIEWSRR